MSHIRIFPHGRDEFPTIDSLTTWLMTALKANAGSYLLRSANSIAELPPGSVVLFRFGDLIVGEGVVREYLREGVTGESLSGEEHQYEAQVRFAPGSVRLFAPPINIKELQSIIGTTLDITVPRGYYIIRDWGVYSKLLTIHVGKAGAFV